MNGIHVIEWLMPGSDGAIYLLYYVPDSLQAAFTHRAPRTYTGRPLP